MPPEGPPFLVLHVVIDVTCLDRFFRFGNGTFRCHLDVEFALPFFPNNRCMLPSIESRLSKELVAKPQQVAADVALLDEGATVPFIARYRKEVTGGLDDIQLRLLEERLRYLRELEERRAAILENIESQGKLNEALAASINAAEDKTTLEDLYLPYKQKRRTKAMIAREAGLEPLADALLSDPMLAASASFSLPCDSMFSNIAARRSSSSRR